MEKVREVKKQDKENKKYMMPKRVTNKSKYERQWYWIRKFCMVIKRFSVF